MAEGSRVRPCQKLERRGQRNPLQVRQPGPVPVVRSNLDFCFLGSLSFARTY